MAELAFAASAASFGLRSVDATGLNGKHHAKLHLLRPAGPTASARAASSRRRHSREHTATGRLPSYPGGTPSRPERSTSNVDSRRAQPSARRPSATRTWTLALSHPVCVVSDACGGTGTGAGTDARSCTRTCTCTRSTARTDRDSGTIGTTALLSYACRSDADESASAWYG